MRIYCALVSSFCDTGSVHSQVAHPHRRSNVAAAATKASARRVREALSVRWCQSCGPKKREESCSKATLGSSCISFVVIEASRTKIL